MTVVAVVVVPIPIARIEVEVVRVVVVVRIERTGPVVAVRTRIVEVPIPAVASSRKKDSLICRQSSDTDTRKECNIIDKPSMITFLFHKVMVSS